MGSFLVSSKHWLMQRLLATLLLCGLWHAPLLLANDAANLRDKYQSLTQQLAHNQFERPLYLDSVESASSLKGDIYAVVDYPYATVNASLNDPKLGPANWCDVLFLHLNTKSCRVASGSNGSILNLDVGKKVSQYLPDVYHLQFNYHVVASGSEYFQVDLNADNGPLGTKDYRIELEAVAISGKRTFIHLTYAYSYGMAGRLAMGSYLATLGRGKVGFTSIDGQSPPQYIGGVRGLVERNTMRYYLAIDAYLGALSTTPEKRLQQRLTGWFDATEQYPRQLHEMERQDYMQMKIQASQPE